MAGSVDALERADFRLLALLVTWFGIHSPWVNADRLIHLVKARPAERILAFWSALAHWKASDHRFSRLESYSGSPIDLLPVGTEFQIARHGEDERFKNSALRVPANLLRDRPGDVLEPAELASRHSAYRWRIIIGPSYRADMWAALETEPGLSAAVLARQTYGSFATAWRVRRDFTMIASASAGTPSCTPTRRG